MKLGFIVNPIAGMGGKVGLKGTDGPEILEKARELGAVPESPGKAKDALKSLLPLKGELEILTYSGDMGENEAREVGFEPTVIGEMGEELDPSNTEEAAVKMLEENVDLILFAGGDGTARNIHNAVGMDVPVIGVPAGVKIHSGVYANYPKAAGDVALHYFQSEDKKTKEAEVMDIDEEAFRDGVVSAKLFGYVKIPQEEELVQSTKSVAPASEDDGLIGIANTVIEEMEDDTFYIISSGTTTRPIMEELGLPNTLLGTDIIKNKELVANDVSEKQILEIIGDEKARIVVTVIGGQGFIFGRGNQQISGRVIKKVGKDNIIVIATERKLDQLKTGPFTSKPLLVYTDDKELNASLEGRMKVLVSYNRRTTKKVKGL